MDLSTKTRWGQKSIRKEGGIDGGRVTVIDEAKFDKGS